MEKTELIIPTSRLHSSDNFGTVRKMTNCTSWSNGIVFSHDVMAAIFVSQNNERAAMFVSQTSSVGVEFFRDLASLMLVTVS